MEAEINITREDVIAFNVHHTKHSPSRRRLRRLAGTVISLVWVLLLAWFILSSDQPSQTALDVWPLWVSLLFFWLLLYFQVSGKDVSTAVDKMLDEGRNAGLLGSRLVTLTLDAVAESGEFSQSQTQWQAVDRIVVTDEHAFFYLSSMTAIIIPKRDFSAEGAFQAFVLKAREYHMAAANASPS